MSDLVLYSTSACHLCEQALALFAQLDDPSRLTVIDIVDDEDLMQRYAIRIPVLGLAGQPEHDLGWPFDALQLQEWLQRHLSVNRP